MEAAKLAVAKLTARKGHFTDVEEVVRPAITWEHVYPQRTELVTEAVDREVHQDHYHTTVQPLAHTETLPARHSHSLLPAKKVQFEHDDVEATRLRLAADAARFQSTSRTEPTSYSRSEQAAVVGEHIHHHVHELVQPIIYKETVVPEVVHTTIPIHERIHIAGEFHGMSALPPKTLEQFRSAASSERRTQAYEGTPRAYHSDLATTFEQLRMGQRNSSPPRASTTPLRTNTKTITNTSTNTTSNFSHNSQPPPVNHQVNTNLANNRVSTNTTTSTSSSVPRTPTNQRINPNTDYTIRRSSSSTSSSSLQSPSTPKTPRSPMMGTQSAIPPMPTRDLAYDSPPMKHGNVAQPVQIAGGDTSPRVSADTSHQSRLRRFF